MFSLNEEFAAFAGELADFDLQLNPRLLKILSGMSEQDEDVRHAADAISGLMQKGFEVRPVRQGINWGKLDIKALRNGEFKFNPYRRQSCEFLARALWPKDGKIVTLLPHQPPLERLLQDSRREFYVFFYSIMNSAIRFREDNPNEQEVPIHVNVSPQTIIKLYLTEDHWALKALLDIAIDFNIEIECIEQNIDEDPKQDQHILYYINNKEEFAKIAIFCKDYGKSLTCDDAGLGTEHHQGVFPHADIEKICLVGLKNDALGEDGVVLLQRTRDFLDARVAQATEDKPLHLVLERPVANDLAVTHALLCAILSPAVRQAIEEGRVVMGVQDYDVSGRPVGLDEPLPAPKAVTIEFETLPGIGQATCVSDIVKLIRRHCRRTHRQDRLIRGCEQHKEGHVSGLERESNAYLNMRTPQAAAA
ncbi:MAG: hypothetical protein JKP92_02460 [Alphaproteobacteria bacterium]|jgi:hypothetical protein|nr:hypothetical protein [Alphaproteobacteria bacterium]